MQSYDPSLCSAYRLALVHGIIGPKEVEAFINELLVRSETLDDALLTAADAHADSVADLTTALTSLSTKAEPERTSGFFMAIAERALVAYPDLADAIAAALYSMAIEDIRPAGEAGREMWRLQDELDLATSGHHGDRASIINRLKVLLKNNASPPDA